MSQSAREYSHPIFSLLREAFSAVGRVFLLSRLWCAIWVYAGHASHPFREKIPGGYEGVSSWILNPWTTYDSQMYLALAAHGYDKMTAPFFPLYPLLLRFAAPNENAMALLGIVVSNVSLLLALMLLYLLVKTEDGASTRKKNETEAQNESASETLNAHAASSEWRARLAVFLMAFSPLSCVFSSVYTESFYAFLLLAAFCCARGVFSFASTRAWFIAGFFAALAALTRNSGPIVFLALLVQWFMAQRASSEKLPRVTLLYASLPLLVFVAFQIALSHHFGGFSSVTSQANYGRRVMFPWMPIYLDIRDVLSGSGFEITTLLGLLTVLSALWMSVRALRRRAPDAILVLGVLLMQLTLSRAIPPYTNTALRLMSSNFPFWTMWSRSLENALQGRTRVLAAALYLLAGALMSYLFGLKTFVSG